MDYCWRSWRSGWKDRWIQKGNITNVLIYVRYSTKLDLPCNYKRHGKDCIES